MDPADLPEELSSLQTQDLGKLGFMQDLLRGIEKILGDRKTGKKEIVFSGEGSVVFSEGKIYAASDAPEFEIDETTHTVRGCSGEIGEALFIPEGVARIGPKAFMNRAGLKKLLGMDSVTSIGEYAFQSCSGLKDIMLPDRLASLGEGAFAGCFALKSITRLALSRRWGWYFRWVFLLGNINLCGESVNAFGLWATAAFAGQSPRVRFSGDGDMRRIEADAFAGCSVLSEITLPAKVQILFSSLWPLLDLLPE
jgi:hypothetical protein